LSTVYIRFSIRPEAQRQRAPVLEQLLARASQRSPIAEWRRDAFGVINSQASPMPAVAAVALVAARGVSAAAFTCVATPLRLAAGMSTVSLPADGILTLDATEALRLSVDFNRQFGDAGTRLTVGRGAVLLCEFDRPLQVSTRDPEQLLGRDLLDSQPSGTDGARLRLLMSEMEMWLFDHPINRERTARGLPSVSSLWLWGGGIPLTALPTIHGWTAGSDPLFAAFGDAGAFSSEAGAGVLVSAEHPDEPSWERVERGWLEPAFAALRAKKIERLELSVGAQCLSVGRARWWGTWRRPRPWWEILA
jgi:hypothetical protein